MLKVKIKKKTENKQQRVWNKLKSCQKITYKTWIEFFGQI